jgi:hypothetical protein
LILEGFRRPLQNEFTSRNKETCDFISKYISGLFPFINHITWLVRACFISKYLEMVVIIYDSV